MNLKIMAVAATFAATATGANANILYDIYGGLTVGGGAATQFADKHTHTDVAQSYGAVFGVDVPVIRIEAEYNFLNDDAARTHLGLINAYAKMPSTVVHPYIGVGVGGVLGGRADGGIDVRHTAAYQGMLGLTFDVPVLPLKVDAEARALYVPDLYTVANVKPDLLHYDLRLKLRYIF